MSDWNNCFDSIVLVSKMASFTFYGKQLKSCGLPLSLTPELNTVHQNNIQVICKVVGDNVIYCCVNLIKQLRNLQLRKPVKCITFVNNHHISFWFTRI